jgi:hypothetical protein
VSIEHALKAVRRRRYPILGAVILALATAAPVGIAGNDDPRSDPVPVAATGEPAGPVVLRGAVEPLPATPLTGITSRSVVQWLVKDGALVKEGDALYRELKQGVSNQLDELRAREQAAALELKNAQQAPPPDFRAEQDAATRAAEARAEAVRRLEAAEAEGAAGIRLAEQTLLRLQAFGDPVEARAYGAAVQLGKLHHQTRMNTLRESVSQATLLMDNANAALAWKRFEAQRRMAELHRAPAMLAAQIRQLESGIAQGRALHDGVVRIKASRVPDGASEIERVVGEIQPPGFELVVPLPKDSRLPDLIVGASARFDGSDFNCERTEMVPETSVVRCLIPGAANVAPGTAGELRLAAAEE